LYFYFIGTISRCIKQSKNELFVKHHLKNYNGRFPFWVLVEILSFSNISKCFKNINTADKKEFLKSYYNYGVKFFENWIENISIVRNIIAHHGRLYNKNINPSLKLLEEDNFNRTRKIFDLIFILKKVIFDKYLWSDFLEKINFLINTYKNDIDFELIGFPKNYMEILEK